MRVRCVSNTGEALRKYEYRVFEKEMIGRFGVTAYSGYDELSIGKEYLVMGVIIFETYQAYLIDDSGVVFTCPCQLFEVVDDRINSNWHLRLIEKNEDIYPFVQAIFGYSELCSDKKSYQNLIVEGDIHTEQIYFNRKKEFEKELYE